MFIGIALSVTAGLMGGGFSPAALFTNGEQGVWLDPGDLTTLFQDTAGTTPVTAVGQSVALALDKSGRGNHATQATAGARPIYALLPSNGLRNLANGSADVGNNAVWQNSVTVNGITATKVASGIDTDGLPYADYRYQGTSTSTFHDGVYAGANRNPAVAGQQWNGSAILRVVGGSTVNTIGLSVRVQEEIAPNTFVDNSPPSRVTASVDTLSTSTNTIATGNQARVIFDLGFSSGAVIDVTYRIKALQFERAAARTDYQFNYSNVNIAQPPFAQVGALLFDGVDDFMQTPSIDFSATDRVTVFAGVRKLSDAARATVVELGVPAPNGYFAVEVPGSASPAYQFVSRGTSTVFVSGSGFPAPDTAVITGIGGISTDTAIIRRNGVQIGSSATDQGTGNYANAVLYIGRRSGVSLPFSGYLFPLIVRGAASSDYQITATENWVNGKTGAY